MSFLRYRFLLRRVRISVVASEGTLAELAAASPGHFLTIRPSYAEKVRSRLRLGLLRSDCRACMTSYRVLVVTNLWPYEADPSYGCFVKAQMDSLRPLGVDYDVLFINGRESRWNYLRPSRNCGSGCAPIAMT